MGMDVIGINPAAEAGEYFRNNVWYWRPLWNYVIDVARDIVNDDVANGCHYNGGSGLNAEQAVALADRLDDEIASGRTATYETAYRARLAALPRSDCEYCDGTGVRTDEVGVDLGMPTKALPVEIAAIVGREHGYCNGCSGEGRVDHPETGYPFDVRNVATFSEFARLSGGFEVW